MIHIDLFSGIGGFSYAVDEVWNDEKVTHIFCDIDPFCQAVIRKHWPDSKIYGDIKELIADTERKRCSCVGEVGEECRSIQDERCVEAEASKREGWNGQPTICLGASVADTKKQGLEGSVKEPQNKHTGWNGKLIADTDPAGLKDRDGEHRRVEASDGERERSPCGCDKLPTVADTSGERLGGRSEDTRRQQSGLFGENIQQIDLLTGGFPCFAEGTLILSDRGYVPIETIHIGDSVLTHQGRWRNVTNTMVREGAKLRRIRGQGIPNLVVTGEHPFYGRKKVQRWNEKRKLSEPEWIEAENMQGCYASQVLPPTSDDGHTSEFWWLVGRCLADGWIVDRKSRKDAGKVVVCCNKSEAEMLDKRIRDAGFNPCRSEERTVTKFHITRNSFYKLFRSFGRHAYGKRIPRIALELDSIKSKALVDGYFSGDGYRDDRGKNKSIRATTVSKSLALGIALLAQRAYGIVAYVREYKGKPTTTIEGRTVNQKTQYFVSIPERNRSAFVDGKYGWKLVRMSEPFGVGRVYNISVEEDESYVADGAIVHNCQPFSHAGKRRGTADNRYLWPEMLEVIRNTRPRWVIAENVRGILSIESGLVFEQVCSDLEKEGYAVWPFIIPAASVNAPHRRDRVWIIGHLGNARSKTFDSEKPRLSEISESRRSDKIIKSDAPDSESFRSGGSACGQCGDGERTILSQERERSEMGCESEGCAEYAPDSENVGNSKGTGQSSINNRQGKAQYGRASSGFDRQEWQKDWPQVASALCDVAYGLPRELVRPDGSRDRNYPWWRIQALKAGGNSIVPQVAVNIMKAIKESDKK